jgi:hypothetical protein
MTMKNMLLVGALVLGFASTAAAAVQQNRLPYAQAAKIVKLSTEIGRQMAKNAPSTLMGKIIAVNGSYLKVETTLRPSGRVLEESVPTDAGTVFNLDGRAARLSDLRPGMTVEVWETAGKATVVRAKTAPHPVTPAPTTPRSGH